MKNLLLSKYSPPKCLVCGSFGVTFSIICRDINMRPPDITTVATAFACDRDVEAAIAITLRKAGFVPTEPV